MKYCILILMIAVSVVSRGQEAEPVAGVLEKLEEIVAIQERAHREQLLLMELGKGDSRDFIASAGNLSEAKIALARERGDQSAEIEELEKLVKGFKELVAIEESLLNEQRTLETSVAEARVALLKAEIRLLRARQDVAGEE